MSIKLAAIASLLTPIILELHNSKNNTAITLDICKIQLTGFRGLVLVLYSELGQVHPWEKRISCSYHNHGKTYGELPVSTQHALLR